MNAVFGTLEQWDKSASLWINSFHTFFTDQIWLFFSAKEVWFPLYILIMILLFIRLRWKKALIAILCIILAVTCCDQMANIVKDATCRLRPNHDPWMIANGVHILEKGGLYGFFSAHAANSFSMAVCSIKLQSGRKDRYRQIFAAIILTWAILVSLSRIFVAKHFLGDVLVGAAVGCIFGQLLYLGAERLHRLFHLDAA